MLFDHFDRIRIINLSHRTDRRVEMESELAKVGLQDDPRVKFFEAYSFPDRGPFRRRGSHGNFMSRIPLLKAAAAAQESILILEDDCDFVFPAVAEFMMPDEWDIFYGGYVASEPENLEGSDIIGSHFMGFSVRAAEAIAGYLVRYLDPDFPPDAQAASEPGFDASIKPSIDGALVWFRRAHPEFQTVFAQLGVQRSSRTDVGDQRWFDRIPGLRHLAQRMRQLLRGRSARTAAKGSYVFDNRGKF